MPTRYHYQVARDFLDAGIDVLVEKPLTADFAEANELVASGDQATVRYFRSVISNASIRRFAVSKAVVKDPKFVECHRLAPFIERGTDVDVVFDLMIHDIDVITSLVRSPIRAGRGGGGAGVDR